MSSTTADTAASEASIIRSFQRDLWNNAARNRRKAQQGGSIHPASTARLIRDARIGLDMSVLDIACGAGDPSLIIAQVVGPLGEVVGLDIAPEMVEAARSLALDLDLQNVHFWTVDDERHIPGKTHRFDAITCRFGLMFMPDPLEALTAWRGALKSTGRISICTHSALPSFSTTMGVVEQIAPAVAKRLNWEAALSLSSLESVELLFAKAGYSRIDVAYEAQPHVSGATVGACWDNMVQRSPLNSELAGLPKSTAAAIRRECVLRLSRTSNMSLDDLFGGTVLFASASL